MTAYVSACRLRGTGRNPFPLHACHASRNQSFNFLNIASYPQGLLAVDSYRSIARIYLIFDESLMINFAGHDISKTYRSAR